MDPLSDDLHRGKPPKSAEQIRSAVESIHSNTATPAAPGPLQEGLAEDERIVLTSFFDPVVCREFQQRLVAAGVMSSARVERRKVSVLVDVADRGRAAELLQEFTRHHPDRPSGDRRPFDFTIFGALFGATIGFSVQGGEMPSTHRAVILMVTFTLFGGLTGSFFDFSRHRYRRTGHFQFGIGEVMIVITMLAVAFLLRRVL